VNRKVFSLIVHMPRFCIVHCWWNACGLFVANKYIRSCLRTSVDASSEQQCLSSGGQLYVAGRCVVVHQNQNQGQAHTWFDARRSCIDNGGELLRVDDDAILEGLVSRFSNWLPPPRRWWIDGVNEIWRWDGG